jgi:hypothetical protein
MKPIKRTWFILAALAALMLVMLAATPGWASTGNCISCHQDAERLKSLLPEKPEEEKSAESEGEG